MKKITLCGSTRFKSDFEGVCKELTKRGFTVYTVSSFDRGVQEPSSEEKELLDLVHLKKIAASDAIVVVGSENGVPYIGQSTRKEILWAKLNGKAVFFQSDLGMGLEGYFESVFNRWPWVDVDGVIGQKKPR